MLNQIVLMMLQFRLQPKFRFLENMAQWLLFMEIQAHITGLCSFRFACLFLECRFARIRRPDSEMTV